MLLSPKQHRAKFAFVGINTVVFLDFTVVLSPKRAWICLSEDLEFTEFQTEATSTEQAWCWQQSLALMPAGAVEFDEFT